MIVGLEDLLVTQLTIQYLKQELSQGNETRSVIWFLSPTLQHHIVDVLGTVLGLGQAFGFFINFMQNLRFVVLFLFHWKRKQ